MKAPRCRLCGSEHWGMCANSPSAKVLGVKPTAPKATVAPKPPPSPPKGKPADMKKPKAKSKAKSRKPAAKPKPAPKASEATKPDQPKPHKDWNRGRKLDSEAHLSVEQTMPWMALGLSRRTFYRYKAAGKIKA